jgi:hypothetical protein
MNGPTIALVIAQMLLADNRLSASLEDGYSAEAERHSRMNSILRRTWPGVRTLKPTDVSFTSGCRPKHDPVLVEADFNGDRQTDYACFIVRTYAERNATLLHEKRGRKEVWLAILLSTDKKGHYRLLYLMRVGKEGAAHDTYVEVRSPGILRRREGGEHVESVSIRHPGVSLVFCERATRVYYWDTKKRKFTWIQTSD